MKTSSGKQLFDGLKPGINELEFGAYNQVVNYINESNPIEISEKSPLDVWFIFLKDGQRIGVVATP